MSARNLELRLTRAAVNQRIGGPDRQREEASYKKLPFAAFLVNRLSGRPLFWLTAVLLLQVTRAEAAPSLDQYGGVLGVACPNGIQPHFYTAKIANRWVFCTPAGHPYFFRGVSFISVDDSLPDQGISNRTIVIQKYGDADYNWANQSTKRLQSWGFNGAAENMSTYILPFGRPAGATMLPVEPTSLISKYALYNQGNYGPGPSKSILHTQAGGAYTGWVGAGSAPDVFDPAFAAYINGRTAGTVADPFWSQIFSSPWTLGYVFDDSDNLFGIGPGLGQAGIDGVVHPNNGWLALASAPSQASAYIANVSQTVTYSDTKVYTKLRIVADLQTKYGTIAALNAAWGSNYTTFGSAGGWPKKTTGGTGLLDEDGSSTGWLGSTDGDGSGTKAAVLADLDAFNLHYWRQYFQILRDCVNRYAPGMNLISPALNSHGGVTRKEIIQAAGEFNDTIALGIQNQQALDSSVLYTGDKPYIFSQFIWSANPDSALWRYPNTYGQTTASQTARGTLYANQSALITNMAASSTGVKPIAGLTWWAWGDSWAEKSNWGLVTFRDNAYDGKEAVSASVPCGPETVQSGYTCGGEEKNYGDFLTPVIAANKNFDSVLLGGATPESQPPTVPATVSAHAVSDSQITVSWSPSTDNTSVLGYQIFRNGVQVGGISSTTFTDAGLMANTAYSYTVAAVDPWNNVSAQSVTASAMTTPAAKLFINAGGTAYTDSKGQLWQSDNYFSGGFADNQPNGLITNTADPLLYQAQRWNNSMDSYNFPVMAGNYTVTLKFAENSPAITAAGQRVFSVNINGVSVLTNFDIWAAAGGKLVAVDKTFSVNAPSGQITVQFVPGTGNLAYPTVSAIQIVPAGFAFSACDVNADGATNVIDVQQTVNQALGIVACTSDINKDGACNVVDVQRVVNAALGGACVSP